MAGAAKRYEKLGLRESLSRIYQYPIACEELSSIVRFAFSKSPKKLQSLVFQDILAAFSILPEMQTRSAISAAHALLQSSEAALPKQKKVLAVKEFKQAMVAQKRRCKARKEDEGLAQLPLDVIDHIFSFLDWRSLVSASAVCRLWNTAASDNHLWKLQYVTLFNKSPINCDLGDGDYIRARGDIDTEHSIDWRSAFKRACKGICSKKFTYYRGYCGHCNSIVWLNETTFSEGLINASNCKNHKLKPVSTLQVAEYILEDSLSSISSSGSDEDSDEESNNSNISKLWAYPKCITKPSH